MQEHLNELKAAVEFKDEDRTINAIIAIVGAALSDIRRVAVALEVGNELQREILAKMDKR